MQNSLRNKVTLIGNVGAAPEVKSFDNDRKLSKISIATNEFYYTNDGGKKQTTHWHNVVAWGKTAEIIANYVEKGQEIGIEGKLINRSYEDKEGNQKYITEVQAHEVLLLGTKNK